MRTLRRPVHEASRFFEGSAQEGKRLLPLKVSNSAIGPSGASEKQLHGQFSHIRAWQFVESWPWPLKLLCPITPSYLLALLPYAAHRGILLHSEVLNINANDWAVFTISLSVEHNRLNKNQTKLNISNWKAKFTPWLVIKNQPLSN